MSDRERLEELDARIKAAKGAVEDEAKPRGASHHGQMEIGWRMVIELVAGLGIGFGMGYGLDWLFGTLPIFLVLFTLLGMVAGVKTMLRSAKEMQQKTEAGAPATDEGA